MILTKTSVFPVDGSTTHPDCSTMSTDRCLNTSRQTDPSLAADQGRHRSPGRLTRYVLALLVALSVLPAAAQDQDTTAPALSSVRINGRQLDLIYDEELDDNSEPDNSAFTITVNGASRGVLAIVVTRTAVVVILYSPVQTGETVTVSYTVPATNPVQDLAGNRAAAITNLTISDNTPATAPPAPTNLTAQAGNRSVTLTWTTPGNGGSTITRHQYQEKVESGEFGNWTNIPNSAAGQTNANSYTVPNRTNGTIYTYQVRAVNAQGESTGSNEASTTPTASPVLLPLTVTWPEDIKGTEDSSIWTSLTSTPRIRVSGGRPPYTYEIDTNGAPDGLEIDQSSGTLIGTPTVNGTFTVRVVARDAAGQSVSNDALNITIHPPLSVSPIAYKTVEQGKRITPIHLSATGGWDPYTYSISGAPSGISLSSDNRITGSPSQAGTSTITVTVTDDHGNTAEHSFNMSVYSIELAKKFSPILILTEHPTRDGRKVIFPEPVEIMGAESVSNLWFHFTDEESQILPDFDLSYQNLSTSERNDLIAFYQRQYPDINFSQNKFASIPEVLTFDAEQSIRGTSVGGVRAHFEYPGVREDDDEGSHNNWSHYYESDTHPKRGDHPNFPHTAYVHIFDEGGQVVIRYHYFYPFND